MTDPDHVTNTPRPGDTPGSRDRTDPTMLIRATDLAEAQMRLAQWRAIEKVVTDHVFQTRLEIIRIEDRLNSRT